MKKFYAVALAILLISSCSDDSEKFQNTPGPTPAPFQGKTADNVSQDFESGDSVERKQADKESVNQKKVTSSKKTKVKKERPVGEEEEEEESTDLEETDIIVDKEIECNDFSPSFSGDPVTVFGKDFFAEATVCEKKLLHRGSAVRVRAGDRFILSAYNTTNSCETDVMINKEEPKYLRLDITRNTAGNRVRGAINENLTANLPADASDELLAQVELASDVFGNDVTAGDVIEISFLPDVGTVFKNKTDELALKGDAINKLMWEVFFGENGCCQQTKDEILTYCEANL